MTANRRRCVLGCLALLGLVACNNDHPADSGVTFKPVATGGHATAANDTPPIPKDAQFTIFCRNFTGETHEQDAQAAQQILLNSTNLKKWYIVHAGDHSTLYYGFYRANTPHDPKDPAEGQRAVDDQNSIRAITDHQGLRIFSEALVVNIDSPDPMANPAWDLTRSKGMWSIEIASFANTPDRKERALQAVRDARAQGIEAYYYHDKVASSVCVGSWPAEAVSVIEAGQDNPNPDQPIFVTTNGVAPGLEKALTEQGIRSVAPHVDIVDPTITQTLQRFPDHATNGYSRTDPNTIDPVTHEAKVIEKSFLVKIPHPDPMDTLTDTAPPPLPVAKPPSQRPGMGQLKSVDE
jgi:hypothetical protein